MDWLLLIAVCIGVLIHWINKHYVPPEERQRLAERAAEVDELRRIGYNEDIQRQYEGHYWIFTPQKCYSDWVPEEYREYMAKEIEMFNEAPFQLSKFGLAAWDFSRAFAWERMIKDKVALPNVLIHESVQLSWDKYQEPTKAAIAMCWRRWKRNHHEELIKHYNETGEFIPIWQWKPIKEIPTP